MNNFIKQISSRASKPTKKITEVSNIVKYKECNIYFNFNNFYYCNNRLFNKPTNCINEIIKSLLVLSSYRYEKDIIESIVNLLIKNAHTHINDIYFTPVGWLTGLYDVTSYHVVIKFIYTGSILHVKSNIRDYLHSRYINKVDIVDENKELIVNKFNIPKVLPVAVLTFYPFNTEYSLLILYFGTYNDIHCGISYIFTKENLPYIVEILKHRVEEIHLLHDEVNQLSSIRINGTPSQKFPMKKVTYISEVIKLFNLSKFEIDTTKTISPLNIVLYIPKVLVSILDLPCNVEIRSVCKNGIEYVTHIENTKLSTILIIIKDKFMRNVSLIGTFVKENLIWKGHYTYRIIKSDFNVPQLKVSKKYSSNNVRKNILFNSSSYTTKIGSCII
ncbi:telomere binding protein [Cetacean poxvirus 1]|nr:telomere binding protein [Cetacean poxvirus 1]